ncbi:histone deacetylase family protein [Oscillatoria salina]|uniref:histone deacetylase family protein n=1 Tax=Oscillatoria salina TaxID=331517 RepID=UPI0013B92A63|nr:histone deacetylase [Oscillatoria salina]MBZ8180204.1 histone deacetylase [Oscillatoria salina IIICB1]NET91242.1 histone deacetylase [Kamptonema sp. SIO1D9]
MLPVIYSDQFLAHDTGRFHPERPERLTAIVKALQNAPWADRIDWQLPTPPQERNVLFWLEQLHDRDYIQLVKEVATGGGGRIDLDTAVSPQSYDVAMLAVSAWLDGVDRVLTSNDPVFVLARPPGHHAERRTGMGFCLFSNAAIAANYALTQPNIKRVAILDWDVHHGNGTQYLLETNPQIAYISLHQSPCYPGTGNASERGMYANVLNLPMSAGSAIAEYQAAFADRVIPFLTKFDPDLLIVSAGYDANDADPLAGISLQPEDYGIFTKYCLQITRRILFGLEGGYDLQALADSVLATIANCLA